MYKGVWLIYMCKYFIDGLTCVLEQVVHSEPESIFHERVEKNNER